jgi:hypothetical protein
LGHGRGPVWVAARIGRSEASIAKFAEKLEAISSNSAGSPFLADFPPEDVLFASCGGKQILHPGYASMARRNKYATYRRGADCQSAAF